MTPCHHYQVKLEYRVEALFSDRRMESKYLRWENLKSQFDNDGMESSKRRSIILSLFFLLKLFTKHFVIRDPLSSPET